MFLSSKNQQPTGMEKSFPEVQFQLIELIKVVKKLQCYTSIANKSG